MNDNAAWLDALEKKLAAQWTEIMDGSGLTQAILNGCSDRRLLALYLAQTYHYAGQSMQTQAIVGLRVGQKDHRYLKFCYKHASEEVGHELMALHDLKRMGVAADRVVNDPPLAATDLLVAYLHGISSVGNPLQRLGYSYWAERWFHYAGPALEALLRNMRLKPEDVTFFTVHAKIDAKHSEEVEEIMRLTVKTEQDRRDIERVMGTSLRLMGGVLNEVYDTYARLQEGKAPEFDYLNVLACPEVATA